MSTVWVTTGLPASGKTTFARTLDAYRFNLDDYRAMLGCDDKGDEREPLANEAMLASAEGFVAAGKDVVMDNTHLHPRLPKLYKKRFGPYGVEFRVADFTDVSVDECFRRNVGRVGEVPVAVINRMAKTLTETNRKNVWHLTDAWMNDYARMSEVVPYVPNKHIDAFICDLDGTLAINDGHRGHYEYERVFDDSPNWPVINLIKSMGQEIDIIFVSGREDRCRTETMNWLNKWVLNEAAIVYGALYMRKTGDHRPDNIVKYEIFDEHIRNRWNVLGVFDDRDRVVAMWRSLGIQTYQVAPGNF